MKEDIPFNLESIEIPEHCPVLGIKLNDPQNPNSTATVDKIVPQLGYVRGNVLVISDLANRIKTNATPAQIRAVADFYENLINTEDKEG